MHGTLLSKKSGHGVEGFTTILADAAFYFNKRCDAPEEFINTFLERYDITDTRRSRLRYFFSLVISDMLAAHEAGEPVYGNSDIVLIETSMLLDKLGSWIMDE